MRQSLILAAVLAAVGSFPPLEARTVVDASEPTNLSVTVYRDPWRDSDQEIDTDWPEGFAMISETRRVTLPAGESTIRFDGVSEGMVGVSAIVTGLPGGTIEKNRNAELLSPAALVNGALGNRVTITRTNPATGAEVSESAVVRTRADGGLVLQSSAGFEAVRCAGLPERLTFDSVPAGLSAKPVFSIDTRDADGGTYEVTLTYLSWGFDWQANYVANLTDKPEGEGFAMNWLSWLTVLNSNGQSFDDAELLVVAGTLNVESDFEDLADPPEANPLRLTCYPIGSTAAGSPVPVLLPPPPPPPPPAPMMAKQGMITVTASRRTEDVMETPLSVMEAGEERLGDLKLYRVPERVDVSAQGIKQVAFLNRQNIEGQLLYELDCDPWSLFDGDGSSPADIYLTTTNEDEKGLGIALPQGAMTVFEPSSFGPQLVAETDLRDYARGQDVELELGASSQVQGQCARTSETDLNEAGKKWSKMRMSLSNANPHDVTMRVLLGTPGRFDYRLRRMQTRVKDGRNIVELTIPANDTLEIDWRMRLSRQYWED
jgi:hypothetical protein